MGEPRQRRTCPNTATIDSVFVIAKSGVPEDHGDVVRGGDAGVLRGMENLDKEKDKPAQKRRTEGMPFGVDYAA